MSKNASSVADRLTSFGQSKFGSRHGWKARFAAALGISTQHLNRYISGSSEPGKKMFLRLIELGCDIHWLLTGMVRSGERLTDGEREILMELKTAGIDNAEQVRYLFNTETLAADYRRCCTQRTSVEVSNRQETATTQEVCIDGGLVFAEAVLPG